MSVSPPSSSPHDYLRAVFERIALQMALMNWLAHGGRGSPSVKANFVP